MRAWISSFLTITFLIVSVAVAAAQEASLAGSIVDGTKASLPGATVTATMIDTGRVSTTVSDERGEYRLRGLAPGRYKVRPSCLDSPPSSFPTSSCWSARTGRCRSPCRWHHYPRP